MLLRSPLFQRLFLPYFALICVGTMAFGWFASGRLKSSHLDDRQQALRQQAALLASLLADDLRAERATQLALRLPSIAAELACRITVVDAAGRVLADTMADPAHMENHGTRPEILAAAQSGVGHNVRHSESVNEDQLYVAIRAAAPDGSRVFVRLSVSLTSVNTHLRSLYWGLAYAALAATLISGLLVSLLAARTARPIADLTRVATALAHGDFTTRARAEDPGEIGDLAHAVNDMADALTTLYARAAHDKEQLLAILSSMGEGVLATDRKLHVVVWNDASVEQFGFSPQQAQGRALWEVVREEAILKTASAVLESRKRETIQIGPIRERHLEVAVCALPAGAEPEGVVIVAHDATEAVRYQELRKEFVANVSHELRTPLTFIRGFVETLRDGALQDPVKAPEYLGIIEKHVVQLTNLVSDLLEISHLESRPALPRRLRVDLGALAGQVVDLLQPAALKKQQTLAIDLPANLPSVFGDPDYLERAISNLVDNAIKYTPEHGSIRVTAARRDAHVSVEVIDNGIGIPAADLPRIFERFYRVEKSRSRDMGGTGLGLAIVKHVVQAHGGTVDATSEPGKGTSIRINLPLEG